MNEVKKPPIAYVLEKRARENLEKKIDALRSCVEHGVAPAGIPKSLRQLNQWSSNGADGAIAFDRNANETLTRHPDIRDAALALIGHLREASRPRSRPREASLRRAKEQASLHLTIRQIAEAALLKAMSETESCRKEILALRAQVRSIAEEALSERERLLDELTELRRRNAELLRSRSTRLTAIRDGDS